jgi:hypothetical protein
MLLELANARHVNTLSHEGKLLMVATVQDGTSFKLYYSVKQDGFEDSALQSPNGSGWETFKLLELPNENADSSVVEKEKSELTYKGDSTKYLLCSEYKSATLSADALVQLVSQDGHVYIFRQSITGKLLVDRFVLDGMTNTLNRKLEVRFKRSKQRYTPSEPAKISSGGQMESFDSLDFRDMQGNSFYEPTTVICPEILTGLANGNFGVVVMPTNEKDIYRWHIFAYINNKVTLVTLRSGDERIFDVQDYWFRSLDEDTDQAIYDSIPGIIKREFTLQKSDNTVLTVSNGLAVTKYDVQHEKQTQNGMQLVRDATKLLLAVPTNQGIAALNFAVAANGTLAQLVAPTGTSLRDQSRNMLLPLTTLENIRAIGATNPPPGGTIIGMSRSTSGDSADRVQVQTASADAANLDKLAIGDIVKLSNTTSYDGLYSVKSTSDGSFIIQAEFKQGEVGNWEKVEEEETGLVFDGMLTGYTKNADGTLTVNAVNHGLAAGDMVQIVGSPDYDGEYPVIEKDQNSFAIQRLWVKGEAVNINLESQKRRGLVFDGVQDGVAVPFQEPVKLSGGFTFELWVKSNSTSNQTLLTLISENPTTSYTLDIGSGNIGFSQRGYSSDRLSDVQAQQYLDDYVDLTRAFTENDKLEKAKNHYEAYRNIEKHRRIALKAAIPASPGGWVHVAVSYDKNLLTLCLNGSQACRISSPGLKLNASALGMAAKVDSVSQDGKANNPSQFFQGQLSEVRLWNIPRTANEINDTMHLQLIGRETGLAGYWKLGGVAPEDDKLRVFDFSANALHGLAFGMPYAGGVTLQRKLRDNTTDAVKFSNDDLFAVSEGTMYEESFEFKIDPWEWQDVCNEGGTIPSAGKQIYRYGNGDNWIKKELTGPVTANNTTFGYDPAPNKSKKCQKLILDLFQPSLWGKLNRDSEDKFAIAPISSDSVETQNGWRTFTCRFMVPEGVRLLRCFEITDLKGGWNTFEIRRHNVRLVSDTVTLATTSELASLATLALAPNNAYPKLREIANLEKQEALLVTRKKWLEQQIDDLNERLKNVTSLETKKRTQQTLVDNLTTQLVAANQELQSQNTSPFNYWCEVVAKHSGKCLDVERASQAQAARVMQGQIHGGNNQLWRMEKVEGNNESAYYVVIARHSDKCLDVDGGKQDQGTQVLQGEIHNGGTGSDNQRWKFVVVEGTGDSAYYQIIAKHSGKCLDVDGASQAQGARVMQGNIWNGDNQQFRLVRLSDQTESGKRNIKIAQETVNDLDGKLATSKTELARLIELIKIPASQIQETISTYNTEKNNIINSLTTNQNRISTKTQEYLSQSISSSRGMVSLSGQDPNGLIIQGAFLDGTDPATRLQAMESCAGRVTLSYQDSQAALCQAHYDTAYDSDGKGEIWLPSTLSVALKRDGTSLTIPASAFATISNQITIEFWAKGGVNLPKISKATILKLDGASQTIQVQLPNEMGEIVWQAGNKISTDGIQRQATAVLYRERWTHWAFVKNCDKGEMKIYANGRLWHANQVTTNDPKNQLTQSLGGITLAVLDGSWEGALAELRIWNVGLGAREIEANSHLSLSGNEPGLVAYYPFSEADGNEARDKTGINAAITGVSGKWIPCTMPLINPQAVAFDGTDSYIQLPAMTFDGTDSYIQLPAMNPDFSQGLTIETWVFYRSFKNWSRIIDCGNGQNSDNFLLANYGTTSTLRFYISKGQSEQWVDANSAVDIGMWIHLAATVDRSGNAKIYKNGQEIANGSVQLPNTINRTRNYIGKSNWSADEYFDGQMRDVRLWKRARNRDEILRDMYRKMDGSEPGLVGCWLLDRISGQAESSRVTDFVSNKSGSMFGNPGINLYASAPWVSNSPVSIPSASLDFINSTQVIKLQDAAGTAAPISLGASWSIETFFKYPLAGNTSWNTLVRGKDNHHHVIVKRENASENLGIFKNGDGDFLSSGYDMRSLNPGWHHLVAIATANTTQFYIDGVKVGNTIPKMTTGDIYCIGNYLETDQSFGTIAELRIWSKALTAQEVAVNFAKPVLAGNENGLQAYFPFIAQRTVSNIVGGSNPGAVFGVTGTTPGSTPVPAVCAEYSRVHVDAQQRKSAMMVRTVALPSPVGVYLLDEQRIEELEMKWVGNAQIKPALLGFIEGAPPVPSENLTVEDDYNGATSVELVQSSDVEFSWTREQDVSLGAEMELLAGVKSETSAGAVVQTSLEEIKSGGGAKMNFAYHWQNASTVGASQSLTSTDRLELRGYKEPDPRFPHLGSRFIPKNIGYALVVSGMADVYVSKLKRSGRMVGYQVLPVEGVPLDINTITFLMNPAYTMAGSLDGLTGSSATSDRFFRQVPEMRSQFGSLYPASYFRIKEAYALKNWIDQQDKQNEAYFNNFNAGLVDETSLDRQIGNTNRDTDAPKIGAGTDSNFEDSPEVKDLKYKIQEQENIIKPISDKKVEARTQQETSSLSAALLLKDDLEKKLQRQKELEQDKRTKQNQERQGKIADQHQDLSARAHAADSFASWQRKMEGLQIRAGKRNIVNTYVWDGDGGFHAEEQQFASTVEHTVGGSFEMGTAIGGQLSMAFSKALVELNAYSTTGLTQTMSKTSSSSKGMELHVDLSGVESRGITDYKDYPILPGEKVDRYRFMTFFLEGSTNHWHDFFTEVVDPEWLASNDEEARALRQASQATPNKTWRVLHRVTYVERPALMGFGRDMRAIATQADEDETSAALKALKQENQEIKAQLAEILNLLKSM